MEVLVWKFDRTPGLGHMAASFKTTHHGNWGRWRFDIAVTPFVENTGGAMARSRVDRNPGAGSHNIWMDTTAYLSRTFRTRPSLDLSRVGSTSVVEMVGPEVRGVQKIPATQELSFFGSKKW